MPLQKSKEAWELYPAIWKSKSAYFTWLRGQIRKIWNFYPPKLAWKNKQLVEPPKGYTGRAKKLGKCHYCSEMFAASSLEVDHVKQAGECCSWETAQQFLYNLLDCNDNWVLACKPCHKIKSYAEKHDLKFEDAMLQKNVISFLKDNTKEKVIDFCQQHGYNSTSLTNAEKRRQAVEEIFKRREHGK